MTVIIRGSKLGRIRDLNSRQLFIDEGSDDARIKVRPEFKQVYDLMMRNRYRIEYMVDMNGVSTFGSPLADEIREHLSMFCNNKCEGFWHVDFKTAPTDEYDPVTGKRSSCYTTMRWTFILMFEQESDLERFIAEQALITKLTF